MKRFLSILLALVLAVPIFWIGNPFSPIVKASADTYRKGYALTAEKADKTGISPDAGFILTVPQPELDAIPGAGSAAEKASAFALELPNRLVLRGGPAISPAATPDMSPAAIPDISPAAAPAGIGLTTRAGLSLAIESAGRNTFLVKPKEILAFIFRREIPQQF